MSITSPLGKSLVPQSLLNMICPPTGGLAYSCCWPYMGRGIKFLLETISDEELERCYPQLKGIPRSPVRAGTPAYTFRAAQVGARLRTAQDLARSTFIARRQMGRDAFDAQLAKTRAAARAQRSANFAAIRQRIATERAIRNVERRIKQTEIETLITKLQITGTKKSLAAAARLTAQSRTWEASRLARQAALDARINRAEASAVAAAEARYAATNERIAANRAAADAALLAQDRARLDQELQQRMGGPPGGAIQKYTVNDDDIPTKDLLCPPGKTWYPLEFLIEQQRLRAVGRQRVFGRPSRRRAVQLARMEDLIKVRLGILQRQGARRRQEPLPSIVPVGRCPAEGEVFTIRDGTAEWRGGGTVIVRQGGTGEGVRAKFKEWRCPYSINLVVGG